METDAVYNILIERYGKKIADYAVFPKHYGWIELPHARGSHETANGESITFFINFDDDLKIENCTFVASAAAIAIASAEIVCTLCQGMRIDMLHKIVTEDAISEVLGEEIPDSDMLGMLLAMEAFRKTLRTLITVSRDPWKRYYAR